MSGDQRAERPPRFLSASVGLGAAAAGLVEFGGVDAQETNPPAVDFERIAIDDTGSPGKFVQRTALEMDRQRTENQEHACRQRKIAQAQWPQLVTTGDATSATGDLAEWGNRQAKGLLIFFG